MDQAIIKECSQRSLAGTITFPEVVQCLAAAGIERYRADLIRLENCYYTSGGEWATTPLAIEWREAVPPEFSAAGVEAAVREIQEDRINYQEFLRRILRAGCSCYTVFIRGRKVVYEGAAGDTHVEKFPAQEP